MKMVVYLNKGVLRLKKVTLSIISVVMMLGLIACSIQNDEVDNNDQKVANKNEQETNVEKDVRDVVWAQLSSVDKERIAGSWEDGKVSKVTLNENMMRQVKEQTYEGKEVYVIDFPTKSISKPHNILVYADVNTLKFIGYGLVD
ncbi:hypothetical protein [Bacillus sp. AK128]